MNMKHAYLIMAHSNLEQLKILLKCLDDERNDIYLHIDKKNTGWVKEDFYSIIYNANIVFVNPIKVNWGGSSQIKAELHLIKEASKTQHQYYHLLSGMDLPLCSQDKIFEFFDRNAGKNFVSLEKKHNHNVSKDFMYRINYYYFFQNIIGRKNGRIYDRLSRWQKYLINQQKRFNFSRTKKKTIDFIKGANWFSITHEAARFIVKNYRKYRKVFSFSFCADEIFLQTILSNSPFFDLLVDDNLRLIDWERGTPYVFRNDDYEMLVNSGKLFARKFDINVDAEIIQRIEECLSKGQ